MRHRKSEEIYLETIFLIEKEKGYARRVDIAEALGYSKPSVTHATKVLKAKNYVYEDNFGYLHLTEAARDKAASAYEKHHLIMKLLVHIGAEPAVAEENAFRIERAISHDLMDIIRNYVGEVTVCG